MSAETIERILLDELSGAFGAQKRLGDGALAQLEDADVNLRLDPLSNSIAVIVKHLHGSMTSRWSDFLTSDGEKAQRRRDEEFEQQGADLAQVRSWWEEAWAVALPALDALTERDLERTVRILGEPHSVPRALLRQLSHIAQHVGQIVLLAKHARGERWQTLSIPRGGTAAFYRAKGFEPR